jgi:hypothetical protein
MGKPGAMIGRFSRLAITMAMLAVMIRVLVPAGFMVAPGSEAGGSRIVICSPQGAVEVLIDSSGNRVKPPADDHGKSKVGEHPCAFATVATATLTSDLVMESAAVIYAGPDSASSSPAQRPGLGLAAPPPPKTGPPILL